MIVKKLPWGEGIFNLGYLGSSVFYNTLLLVPWVDCVGDIIEGHQLRIGVFTGQPFVGYKENYFIRNNPDNLRLILSIRAKAKFFSHSHIIQS